jgi:hypothetical protein
VTASVLRNRAMVPPLPAATPNVLPAQPTPSVSALYARHVPLPTASTLTSHSQPVSALHQPARNVVARAVTQHVHLAAAPSTSSTLSNHSPVLTAPPRSVIAASVPVASVTPSDAVLLSFMKFRHLLERAMRDEAVYTLAFDTTYRVQMRQKGVKLAFNIEKKRNNKNGEKVSF